MQAVNLSELASWTSVADHLLEAVTTLKLGAFCLSSIAGIGTGLLGLILHY